MLDWFRRQMKTPNRIQRFGGVVVFISFVLGLIIAIIAIQTGAPAGGLLVTIFEITIYIAIVGSFFMLTGSCWGSIRLLLGKDPETGK